ncbi:hypothetical protein SPRG_07543 [Saprolegnia parasitica CBS 223.65]|uniref:Uncharacterized protein n=1 Tax=Saprolegnia parasitica (strain CBS 223.65) TaxID=695850 RepID=A0A067C9Y3_SAPPC|nr:hypothetical protein SPRG_07543 [Saprolegnia parasitica CBS 223.65]KDO27293.1 hypothetical protein SPRG_07543 [Saprolegnia parasitica CBS 223.65]|eukprot:XP_012202067.1 hypothetical protein SPRG_07543 [Saprolegnia parasitica CBS 223.65]
MDDLRLPVRSILRTSKARVDAPAKKSAMKSPAKRRRGPEGPTPTKPGKAMLHTMDFLDGIASPRRVTFSPFVARTPKRPKVDASTNDDENTDEDADEAAATVRKQRRMRMRFQHVRRQPLHARLTKWVRGWWSGKQYEPLFSADDEAPARPPYTPVPDFTHDDRAYNEQYDRRVEEAAQRENVAPSNAVFLDEIPLELALPCDGAFDQLADTLRPRVVAPISPTLAKLCDDLPGVRRLCSSTT